MIALLGGCAGAPERLPQSAHAGAAADAENTLLRQALIAQYKQWKGTPYRIGGQSRSGIDCSGFTQITYLDRLGIPLPRSTALQAKTGRAAPRNALRAGDLVFFKTGFKTRHVGIYMGNDRFLHASTSRGVMISSLSNPYWAKRYWQARRVKE